MAQERGIQDMSSGRDQPQDRQNVSSQLLNQLRTELFLKTLINLDKNKESLETIVYLLLMEEKIPGDILQTLRKNVELIE